MPFLLIDPPVGPFAPEDELRAWRATLLGWRREPQFAHDDYQRDIAAALDQVERRMDVHGIEYGPR